MLGCGLLTRAWLCRFIGPLTDPRALGVIWTKPGKSLARHVLQVCREYVNCYNDARPSQATHAIPGPYPELRMPPLATGRQWDWRALRRSTVFVSNVRSVRVALDSATLEFAAILHKAELSVSRSSSLGVGLARANRIGADPTVFEAQILRELIMNRLRLPS